jgi:1,4-dihydroxy-2-naphthoate octaprenyltransferase
MNTNIHKNSTKAWLLAIRPKTLTGAAIPVLLGSTLAYIYGAWQLIPCLLCFLFAFLMQIDANFINDLYDFLLTIYYKKLLDLVYSTFQ